MEEPSGKAASTRVSRIIHATPEAIYQAFLDPHAVATWLPPDGMTAEVHAFDAREGGAFSMSLTYQDVQHSQTGKTSGHTDTFQGRFTQLLPFERIVQVVEFESQEARFAGEMTITWTLAEVGEGTKVTALCEDIPVGIRPEDNETGSQSSLRKLAAFIE